MRFDNCPRILTRGEDFDETAHQFKRTLVTRAAQEGMDIVARTVQGDRVLYQVFPVGGQIPELPPMPDQRIKYPWGVWFDGNEHEIRKGAEFTCEVVTFKAHVYHQAYKRGMKVRLEWPFADVAKLQAYKPEGQ